MTQVILGFDVGTHKVGVAVGQTLTKKAKPLPRLMAKNGAVEKKEVEKLLSEWRPNIIVVGVPTMMDGKKQFTTELALGFIDFLKSFIQLPIYAVDERLTTKTARSDIFEQGGYKTLKKADIDGYAAKLIVESWLQEN